VGEVAVPSFLYGRNKNKPDFDDDWKHDIGAIYGRISFCSIVSPGILDQFLLFHLHIFSFLHLREGKEETICFSQSLAGCGVSYRAKKKASNELETPDVTTCERGWISRTET
jgi:hypothetical protein